MSGLKKFIEQFSAQRVLVIGDVIADVYLAGKISRISREAPVLVLEHAGETLVPGGAANVMHNVVALGGKVCAVGVVGADQAGRDLRLTLARAGVDTEGLLVDESRPTITKTRVTAGGQATVRQQVVRIDREARQPLSSSLEQQLLDYALAQLAYSQAVVFSDYGGVTVSPRIRSAIIAACNQNNIPCIVDSRYHIRHYQTVQLLKQNEAELAAAVGYPLADEAAIISAGRQLLNELNASAALITRGPEGMVLLEQVGTVTLIPVANVSEVYDVSGAGDTVVAAMMLAVAAGAPRPLAARLANYAAGVVVRKPGTAVTTAVELTQAIGTEL